MATDFRGLPQDFACPYPILDRKRDRGHRQAVDLRAIARDSAALARLWHDASAAPHRARRSQECRSAMTLILPQLDPDSGQIPDEVKKRLEELYSLDILDTSSEERFGRYTELATNVLDAPYASAVLIDEDRLIFKAVSVSGKVDRDHSFAVHATSEEELLVVEDARQDARFAEHPLVRGEPYVR